MKNKYDIIVLGSGIAGTIAALVLQRAGLETLVVERKSHPRFVIGESTLPTTTFLLRHLASTYGVPEVAEIAHYTDLRANGLAAWPKQTFWYGVHRAHTPLDQRWEAMLETLLLPLGPDVHMLRSDADAFLASRLERYGVDYLENTELVDFHARGNEGIEIRIRGPEGERDVSAGFLVDATGHASFLARRFGLRDEDARLHTNTRSIFGHFADVPDLDEVLGGHNPLFRFNRSSGTQHHCFPGGWVWVIPFDNEVTSVGFQVDRRMYPLDESITPEEEIRRICERFPTVGKHLGAMRPIRPLIRADRIQFTTSSILGQGFALTPHAAAFIDPLFSTGIVLTLAFVTRFVPVALAAHAAGDWNIERFRFIEKHFFAEVQQIDRIVNGMFHAFRDYDVFKQYWRTWIMGTLAQFNTAILSNGITREVPMLYGTGVPGFAEAVEKMHQMVLQPDADPIALATRLEELVEPWWERLCLPTITTNGDWSVGSDRSVCAYGTNAPEPLQTWQLRIDAGLGHGDPAIKLANAEAFLQLAGSMHASQMDRYHRSRQEGTDYHRAYERILRQTNPATFDYESAIGLTRS